MGSGCGVEAEGGVDEGPRLLHTTSVSPDELARGARFRLAPRGRSSALFMVITPQAARERDVTRAARTVCPAGGEERQWSIDRA